MHRPTPPVPRKHLQAVRPWLHYNHVGYRNCASPNPLAWKTGTVQLQIKPLVSILHRQDILVHPHSVEAFAVQDVRPIHYSTGRMLWIHQDALFVNPKHPQFIQTLPPKSTFGNSVHLDSTTFIDLRNNIYVLPIVGERTSPQLRTTIPATDGSYVHTDSTGRYMIPIWVGNHETGTLYMLILIDKVDPSFANPAVRSQKNVSVH